MDRRANEVLISAVVLPKTSQSQEAEEEVDHGAREPDRRNSDPRAVMRKRRR